VSDTGSKGGGIRRQDCRMARKSGPSTREKWKLLPLLLLPLLHPAAAFVPPYRNPDIAFDAREALVTDNRVESISFRRLSVKCAEATSSAPPASPPQRPPSSPRSSEANQRSVISSTLPGGNWPPNGFRPFKSLREENGDVVLDVDEPHQPLIAPLTSQFFAGFQLRELDDSNMNTFLKDTGKIQKT